MSEKKKSKKKKTKKTEKKENGNFFDKEQEQAIKHLEGPLLIVAGAGTGKTRVITERVAYLINSKIVTPDKILALTFSEKAAKEMEKRVDMLVPYGMVDATISTFHSFGYEILQENFTELRISPDWKLLRSPEMVIFIVENIDYFNLSIYKPLNNPTKFLSEFVRFISKLKDNLITPDIYLKYVNELKEKIKTKEDEEEYKKHYELAEFYKKYEELKTEKNYFDFGDLILKPYYLFKEKASVLKKYQDRFLYILVDEFQDTNYAQFELLKLLAEKNKNITVVGDDDQMIYRFRGAAISNIMNFKDYYKDAKIVVLKNNYRTEQFILDSAYKVIQNNEDRLEKKLKINKHLISKYKPEVKNEKSVVIKLFDDYSEEADFIAKEIKELVEKKGYMYKDIAILVRAKNDAKMFINTLGIKGIPYKFTGDEGIYTKPEVQFFINFCRTLATPYEFNPLFHIGISEFYNINPYTLSKIGNRSKDFSITTFDMLQNIDKYPELEISEDEKHRIEILVKDILFYIEKIKEGWKTGEILYDFIKQKKVFENLLKEKTIESEKKLANIAMFFEIVKQFSISEEYDTINNFVEYIDLRQKAGDNPVEDIFSDIEEDAVLVATVHKVKGLEFKVVFIVGLVQDKFPVRGRKSSLPLPEEILKDVVEEDTYLREEERRLFYVAMTRAKDLLFLTASSKYDGGRERKISVFLQELGVNKDEKIEKKELVDKIKIFERIKNPITEYKFKRKESILWLSNYQIDDYLTCPYKYKLIHILKMPIRENPEVVYGQAIHRVVAEYYRAKIENREITLDELKNIFKALWRPVGFISAGHERLRFERGMQVIENFFNIENKKNIIPEYIEKGFELKLNNELGITGRWDRIDKRGKETIILDYKTSEVADIKKAEEKLKSSDISKQLNLYSLAYLKLFNKLPEKVGIYFVESNIEITKKIRKNTLENFEKKIFEVAENIKAEKFEPTPNPFTCSQCAFFNICEFSKADVLF